MEQEKSTPQSGKKFLGWGVITKNKHVLIIAHDGGKVNEKKKKGN